MTVADAEKKSLVFLRPFGNFVVVDLPFVMLRVFQSVISRSAPIELQFPSDLLLSPTVNRPWSWQDFEMILPYAQAALCNAISLIDPARLPRSVQLLLRGGIGLARLLDLKLSLTTQLHVYFESQQCDTYLTHLVDPPQIPQADVGPSPSRLLDPLQGRPRTRHLRRRFRLQNGQCSHRFPPVLSPSPSIAREACRPILSGETLQPRCDVSHVSHRFNSSVVSTVPCCPCSV